MPAERPFYEFSESGIGNEEIVGRSEALRSTQTLRKPRNRVQTDWQ